MFTFPHDEGLDDGLPVSVVYRRLKYNGQPQAGQVIALFPFIGAGASVNECQCYMHTGQHGAADYWHIIEQSDPAGFLEKDSNAVPDLHEELKARGYVLAPMTHEFALYEAGRHDAKRDAKDAERETEVSFLSCPFCENGGDIEGGPVEVDAYYAWQDVSCSQCKKEWKEHYKADYRSDMNGEPLNA